MLLSQLVNYCFWNVCRDIHTGGNCTFSSLMEAYTSERTIGFVYFLSDGNHDAVKGLCPHSVLHETVPGCRLVCLQDLSRK